MNYIENLLILISAVTGCVSISAFASLADIPVGITSSAIGLKICVITAGIKKYKSIIKKKKKKHDKIVLLAKSKVNSTGVVIYLFDSNINHDEFLLINSVLKELYDMKEEINILMINKSLNYTYKNLSYCLKCRKNTGSKNPKVVRAKNGKIILLSKWAVCNSKKSKFLREQEARGLLSSFGMKTPLH